MLYVDASTGALYNAPLGGKPGDQEATSDQIAAWQASLAQQQLATMSVTAFQAQAAMSLALSQNITTFDLLAKVQQIVAASTNPLVSIAWNKAQAFDRQSPMILQLAEAIPLSDSQLDQLFQLASTLTA